MNVMKILKEKLDLKELEAKWQRTVTCFIAVGTPTFAGGLAKAQ